MRRGKGGVGEKGGVLLYGSMVKDPILYGDTFVSILIPSHIMGLYGVMRIGLISTNIVRYDSPACSKRGEWERGG